MIPHAPNLSSKLNNIATKQSRWNPVKEAATEFTPGVINLSPPSFFNCSSHGLRKSVPHRGKKGAYILKITFEKSISKKKFPASSGDEGKIKTFKKLSYKNILQYLLLPTFSFLRKPDLNHSSPLRLPDF